MTDDINMPPKDFQVTEEERIDNIESMLENMQSVIDKIPDEEMRTALRTCYKDIGRNCDLISKKLATSELKKLELESARERDRNKMLMEKSRNTANILSQFLQKDLVATIVGAALLIMLVTGSMFTGVLSSGIIDNAFLLILGYFFGQTAGKSTSSQEQR
jgi:hypothetical protein